MATKTKKVRNSTNPSLLKATEGLTDIVTAEAETKVVRKNQYGKIMTFGWLLLLLGGLGHMLPEQMAPVLKWALLGVTLQTAVGVLSVIVALYYLLEE